MKTLLRSSTSRYGVGCKRPKNSATAALSAEAVERLQVDRVEALADAEQENADHDESDEDREGDADLDHQRHALGAGRGKHEAVLERHEADDLTDGVAPRHHHQEAQQHDRERKGEIFACTRT